MNVLARFPTGPAAGAYTPLPAGPGGKACGPIGVLVNCAVVAFIDESP